jgi:hypothetical protein
VNERLVLLFVVGVLLLNYPVLAIFNRSTTIGGMPGLYLYLFAVWALGIGAVWLLARRRWEGEE